MVILSRRMYSSMARSIQLDKISITNLKYFLKCWETRPICLDTILACLEYLNVNKQLLELFYSKSLIFLSHTLYKPQMGTITIKTH